jgi:C4-type Zn-finger protein
MQDRVTVIIENPTAWSVIVSERQNTGKGLKKQAEDEGNKGKKSRR